MLSQLIVNSFITGSIYALIALSFAFIYGPTKYFNLAHGSFVVVGAYLYYTFNVDLHLGIAVSTTITALCVGLLGVIMYEMVFGPLSSGRKLGWVTLGTSLMVLAVVGTYYLTHMKGLQEPDTSPLVVTLVAFGVLGLFALLAMLLPAKKIGSKTSGGLVPIVASLGIMTIIQSVLALIYGSHYKSIPGTSDIPTYSLFFGARITLVQIIIFLTGVGSCASLMWMTFHTRFGRSIVALSDSHEMARIVGISPDKSIAWVFFVGAALAGVSGVLVAYDVGVEPAMGMELLLKGAIASIIGGVGHLWGAITGGMILGTVENFGIWKLPVEWKSAIAFVVLIFFLLIKPEGLLKKK